MDTLIKCIAVASANDACVAMAEHIAGSEEEFVNKMNERAKELGMEHTHFVNCNGLDADGHLTTARDISLMSPGTDPSISTDPGLCNDLDGKYHPYHEKKAVQNSV